jgi:protoheme IX farnesyltransferase
MMGRDWLELTKPRLTGLVGVTVVAGSYLAGGASDPVALAAAAIGTTFLGGGSSALNQAMEAHYDAMMERTRNRPIAAGRITRGEGVTFGVALCLAGVILLCATNALTIGLGLLALFTYLAVYTPMKRTSAACTLVGAIPGALPPVMGCTAVSGELTIGAVLLFGILFLWQLPHFLAFAWYRRDDYARGGFAMLSVVDPGGGLLVRQVLLYSLALIPASLLPVMFGVAGGRYFQAALVLGVAFLACSVALAWYRSNAVARRLFYASLVYLPLLLTFLVTDRVIR